MGRSAPIACFATGLITLTSTVADAYAYRRPQDSATAGVSVQSQNGAPHTHNGRGNMNLASNNTQAPPYAYAYALAMPADGNWRWIEARCIDARNGSVCVDGHWLRRAPGRCEEVSSHTVRQGQYIRIVPKGPVNTCRR